MRKQILFLAGVFFLMTHILMGQNSVAGSGKLTPEQMTASMGKDYTYTGTERLPSKSTLDHYL